MVRNNHWHEASTPVERTSRLRHPLSIDRAPIGIDVFACLPSFAAILRQSRRWLADLLLYRKVRRISRGARFGCGETKTLNYCTNRFAPQRLLDGTRWITPELVKSKTSSDDLLTTQRFGFSEDRNFSMKKFASIVFLLVTMVSGCSVLENSERFYRDHPLTDIYFHEYNDD